MKAFLFSVQAADVLSFAAEYLIIIFFFRRLENRAARWQRWLGYGCLTVLCYLYLTPQAGTIFPRHSMASLAVQLGRMTVHILGIFGFLTCSKEMNRSCAAYQSGYFTVLYLTVQNLRMSIMLLCRVLSDPASGYLEATYSAILLELLLAAVIRGKVPLPADQKVGGIRWTTVGIGCVLQLFFKWSLPTMQDQPAHQQTIDAVLFAIIAALGVLLILSLFEVSQKAQFDKTQAQLEQVSLNYEMQNAKRALQTNNDIRRLYHDMKHHLLAIQSMAGSEGELQTYLSDLLPRFEGYESQVSTGSPTVDALLSEKIQRAALDDIRFNICLNLSRLSFVKSVDMITVFGNAMDNAIEAVQMLPTGVERIVYIKSTHFANLTVLRFDNQFTGPRILRDGVLPTGKADPDMHGIGLSSIRKAVKRYGGSVDTKADNDRGWFSLTVMIPDLEQ